jgi:hypothetical protein
MTKPETLKFLALIASYFPQFRGFEQAPVVEAWAGALQDLEFATACEAIRKLALTFTASMYPNIGHIRKAYLDVTEPDLLLDPGSAWEMIVKAAQSFGRNRHKEALLSLPPSLRAIVKALGWRNICDSTEIDILRAHFLKMYRVSQVRQQEQAMLPSEESQPALTSRISQHVATIGQSMPIEPEYTQRQRLQQQASRMRKGAA